MLEFLLGVLIILVCIICESFFSGTETAIVSLDKAKIKALAEKGDKSAIGINSFLEKPENFFFYHTSWHKPFCRHKQYHCHNYGYSIFWRKV